ncbi:hypothetical protein P4O66_012748 [Electrophorus voltai]|uniref:Ig-like domain-containing protein n=1 Tax=Electrophorus voltai TaxID=2609070 RepID=A0AAD8Z5F1_9TELE|nr:hypothetical protein P4O66_012748 [Electrophorus voltai]
MLLSLWFVFIVILVFPLKSLKALKMAEAKLGHSITLMCGMSYHHEINWLRMGLDLKPKTLMVMGLKNDGDLSVSWNSNESHFEGCVQNRFIGLKILKVLHSDLVTYFCAASNGKRMEFGEGICLYTNHSEPTSHNTPQATPVTPKGGLTQTHLIIALMLCVGLLLMVLTIIAVHMKARQSVT